MKSLTSWLIVLFAGMFWILRLIVLFTYSMGIDFPIKPINEQTEVILQFITIVCIVLIAKRKMAGGIIYMLTHIVYFGISAFLGAMILFSGIADINSVLPILVSIIGVVLPIFAFIDLLFDKTRKTSGGNKQTDWFYKNKDFDREYDERADKNQYKF